MKPRFSHKWMAGVRWGAILIITLVWLVPPVAWSATPPTTTTLPDGTKVTTNADGSKTSEYTDGTRSTQNTDGSRTVQGKDGTKTTYKPDGTRVTERPGKKPEEDKPLASRMRRDGGTEHTYTDGTKVKFKAGGRFETEVPGEKGKTETDYNPDGSRSVKAPEGSQHSVNVNVNTRFFDGALPINPSAAIRVDYSPPIVWGQGTFNLSPYVSPWSIPSVNIRGHKPFDHGGIFQNKIDSGSIWGINAGLMHVSDLEKWGLESECFDILGTLMFGLGWVRYDFDMKRLAVPQNPFQEARGFNSTDNALRIDFNAGVSARWGDYSLGIRGGVAPTHTNIFNGGNKWRTEGSVGLVGGIRW